jgi:cytochrome b561
MASNRITPEEKKEMRSAENLADHAGRILFVVIFLVLLILGALGV